MAFPRYFYPGWVTILRALDYSMLNLKKLYNMLLLKEGSWIVVGEQEYPTVL